MTVTDRVRKLEEENKTNALFHGCLANLSDEKKNKKTESIFHYGCIAGFQKLGTCSQACS